MRFFIPAILLWLLPAVVSAQWRDFRFTLFNQSARSVTVRIPGNDKTDSVPARSTKEMVFQLGKEEVGFYLELSTLNISHASFDYAMIRVLDTSGARQATVTQAGNLNFKRTESEEIVYRVRPGLRLKNFWKLDSVINKHAGNIAAADILYLSVCDIDVPQDTIRDFFRRLTPAVQFSAFGTRIRDYLAARALLQVGNTLPAIRLPDSLGNLVGPGFNSDYVLLDFWYSRCTPCIQSFPELKQFYSRTRRKQVQVVGITVDGKEDQLLWKKTLQQHSLPWVNLQDAGARFAGKLAIVNYPTRILVDKHGKILLLDTSNSNGHFLEEVEKRVR